MGVSASNWDQLTDEFNYDIIFLILYFQIIYLKVYVLDAFKVIRSRKKANLTLSNQARSVYKK